MKALVNNNTLIELNAENDISPTLFREGNTLILRFGNKNIPCKLIEEDRQSRRYVIEVAKKKFTVQLKTPLDQQIDRMGYKNKTGNTVNNIKSPMPGMVFQINKKAGDSVEKGETILILEAMKMENAIKSPMDGVIKSINVNEGQAIEKGLLLIQFEE